MLFLQVVPMGNHGWRNLRSGHWITIRSALRALGRDCRGASIIEFAIVAPALFALFIAILECSLLFFAQEALETTAEKAARLIFTGQVQNAGTSQAAFKTQVCNTLPPFMTCNYLMIDVQSVSSFANASTTRPTITYDSHGNMTSTFSYDAGTSGSIVIVRAMYYWPVISGPLGFSISKDASGRHLLVATEVSKTEPYSQSAT